MKTFSIGSGPLSVALIQKLIEEQVHLGLSDSAISAIQNCRDFLDRKMVESNEPVYGINTGFGYLQHVKVPEASLTDLQENLLLSHACGTEILYLEKW